MCDKFHSYIVFCRLRNWYELIQLTLWRHGLQSPHREGNLYRDYLCNLLNYCVAVFIRKHKMSHVHWGFHLSCRWEGAILNYSLTLYTVGGIKVLNLYKWYIDVLFLHTLTNLAKYILRNISIYLGLNPCRHNALNYMWILDIYSTVTLKSSPLFRGAIYGEMWESHS
jgi:hypothetical protein